MDFNPLWILVGLTVLGLVVKGLFWLRDVHTAKQSWVKFTTETFPEFVKEVFLRLPDKPEIAHSSPSQLTEVGEELAAFLRAKEWAIQTATIVVSKVVNKRPFEIEDFSRTYVASELDPVMTERVAACAYEFGRERVGVESVLWVVLRDELIRRVEQAKAKSD